MRKFIFFCLLVIFVVGPVVFLVAAMETDPLVKSRKTGTSADARRAKALFKELRALTEAGSNKSVLKVTQADLNSVVAFVARAVPSMRGRASVRSDAVRLASSVKVPGGWWLNSQISVAPSKAGLEIASIRLGSFELPPGAILPLVRLGLNVVFGDGVGTILTTSIDGVEIKGRRVLVGVGISDAERETLTTSVKSKLQSVADVSAEDVRKFYLAIDAAARKRGTKSGGSIVQFLQVMMDLVQERSAGGDPTDAKRAALLALAIYCGHEKVQDLIGDVVPENMRGKRTRCSGARLNGRHDLRQHFVISAGLEVASNASVAFTIGEFKELLDSTRGGSGFSFDDLAADRAGIRFAGALIDADIAAWPKLRKRLSGEKDVFPSIKGLPAGLSKSEFERRYGDVESAAYKKVLANIDDRIDALALYAGQ